MAFFSMTKTVLKSLFGSPATVKYPFAPREFAARSRGKITITIDTCIFCGLCQRKCPTDAITVNKAEKTWTIDRLKCIMCGACVEACPKDCLVQENRYSEPVAERKSGTLKVTATAK
jgi:formate hydrogenlyase subunit 6/NADH:ubiquinone oxidoreductase subunit I